MTVTTWLERQSVAVRFIVTLVLGAVIVAGWLWWDSRPDSPDTGSEIGAWTFCQFAVEEQLVSPASAKFPSHYPTYTDRIGTAAYRVAAFVDSHNAFGATLRTDFVCEASYSDGVWRLRRLDMG